MKRKLSPIQREDLLSRLRARFDNHRSRHQVLVWSKLHDKLKSCPDKLASLYEMEISGGEPDVVSHDSTTDEYLFIDCSLETPKGRVSVCYDREGLESRKDHKPKTSAMDMAAEMGIEVLTEEEYQQLQMLVSLTRKPRAG